MLRPLALTAVAVLLGAVAACGGGSSTDEATTQEYCTELQSAQKEFGAISSGDITGANLDKIFDRMHTLADKAPAPVADDWKTLDGAISQMESGLQDLGLDFKDLSDPRKLAQVDPQKLQQFGQRMQQVGGQKFQQAGSAIEKHAKQVCHIRLGQS
jgi:uncharacterized protein (DUF3084 family)